MKVKDLKKLLESANPEMEIVVEGSDHSYRRAHGCILTARKEGGDYYENWDGELQKGEKRETVLHFN